MVVARVKEESVKYFSMFSGIGGFELGIRQSETKSEDSANSKGRASQLPRRSFCIGFSEIDKYAISIYEKHFKGHKNYGDATKIKPEELPEFDLLCGGFPCQAFSIAGKRHGFSDTRGTMFFEIVRIVKQNQPRFLLLENVKGLLSHDKGRTFITIINTLDELGYDCQWQVLNSKNFGVPQNRERVFIVGHLRGTSRPKVFPITGTNGKDIIVNGVLDTETWRKRHEQIRRLHCPEGSSPTLPTGTGGGVMTKIMKGTEIRRLTPTECERLQGFPDGWTEEGIDINGNPVTISDTQQKMIKLFDSGKSAREISRILSLHTTSVTRVLKRHGRKMCTNKGPDHPNWKGGRGLKSGYWTVYAPDHPRALNNNRVWEHILVMEKHLGRRIKKDEHIHHIDLDRKNNSIDNLYVCSKNEHAKIHGDLEELISKLLKKGVVQFKNGKYVWVTL